MRGHHDVANDDRSRIVNNAYQKRGREGEHYDVGYIVHVTIITTAICCEWYLWNEETEEGVERLRPIESLVCSVEQRDGGR